MRTYDSLRQTQKQKRKLAAISLEIAKKNILVKYILTKNNLDLLQQDEAHWLTAKSWKTRFIGHTNYETIHLGLFVPRRVGILILILIFFLRIHFAHWMQLGICVVTWETWTTKTLHFDFEFFFLRINIAH